MSEYIDFEVARKYLHEACAGLGSNGGLMLKIKFDQEPKVDVVEVVHGEWIKMDKRGNNVRCSKCGNTLDLRGVNAGRGDANYCPNCGAYMRGEDDAEIH